VPGSNAGGDGETMISFLAPAALGAAVLAALPIAIHLLTNRAATQRSFPALAFLRRAHAGTAKRGRLRDLLVLIARMLLILALVGALAAPVARMVGGSGAPVVVIIDASASMQQRHQGTALWDHAISTAARLSDELAERPVLALVAGTPLQRSGLVPTLDRGGYRALLATAKPGWGAGANDQALALALGLLTGGGDIYLIGDGSRGVVSGIDPQAMPPGVVLHLVEAGGGGDNQGVRSIALEPGVAVLGRPCTVRGDVVNHGASTVTLSVAVNLGDERRTRSVTIPSGSSVTVAETFTPARAGEIPVSVAIVARDAGASDHLAADDRRDGAISVRPSLPVVIYSDADPSAIDGPLKPLLAGLGAAGLAPVVLRGAQLNEMYHAVDDLAVVMTVALTKPPTDGRALSAHLLGGGALLQVLVSDADAALSGALAGIDPPLLPLPPVDLSDRRRGLVLGEIVLDHPLLDGLRGREPLLRQIEAWRYRPATLGVVATRLLAWEDGSVALAERRIGAGRWLALAISPADRDSNLAALEVLPLLTSRLGQVLLPRSREDCALPCGTAVPSAVPLQAADRRLIPVVDGACWLVEPGLYRADQRLIAAAIPGLESDLRHVPPPPGSERTRSSDGEGAVAAATTRPLWHWLLVLAMGLLLTESLLTGAWRRREHRA
jgi:hypothetical protein